MNAPLPTRYRQGVLLKVAYDGSLYSGLAIQDNAHTVAGELQRAIRLMDPEASSVRVCSRTDAGVHARSQYIAFDTNKEISNRGWLLGLTGHLPADVAILSAARVQPAFRPSNHALAKTYSYLVLQGTIRDPFLERRSWRVFDRLNHSRMRAEAAALIGTHDFRGFRGRNDFRTNTIRTISRVELDVLPEQPRVLRLRVTGTAFLYHMMRIITGTLVDVGRGRCVPGAIARAIESGQRSDLGMTAPAAGLYLDSIELDDYGTQQWPYHLDGASEESSSEVNLAVN